MSLEVETILAAALMMAVFSAVAAVGTSIVLGAGFERLRAGFEVISKQTGFFSDAIHKLEQKMDVVDKQTGTFSESITQLEAKVSNVGDQANAFSDTVQDLKKKVEVVDKQTGFFGNAIHKLEKKVDSMDEHSDIVSEKIEKHADADLISTGKAEALVSHAEDLLTRVSTLASQMEDQKAQAQATEQRSEMHLSIPRNLAHYVFNGSRDDSEEIRIN